MICPSKSFAASSSEHLVAEALEEIAAQEITVELIDPAFSNIPVSTTFCTSRAIWSGNSTCSVFI